MIGLILNLKLLNYTVSSGITGVQVHNVTTNDYVRTSNKSKYVSKNRSFGKKYTYRIRTYYKTSSGKYYYSYYTDSKSMTTKSLKNNVFDDTIYKFYQGNYGYSSCGVSIPSSGCGPTAMAIITSSMKGKKITPVTMANYGCSTSTFSRAGTGAKYVNKVVSKYNLNAKWYSKADANDVLIQLSNGNSLVLARMGKGHFTSGGHWIVLTGVKDNNKVKVQDPASSSRSKWWNWSIVKDELKSKDDGTSLLVVKKK